jgi:hypothetical protein
MTKRSTDVYTSLGGSYKKYKVTGVDFSGRSRGSDKHLDTMEEVREYVKELMDLGKFVVIYIHKRDTKPPRKGYVLTHAPEYVLVKEYKLKSGGWK